jgi:hypothetical protein
MLEQLRHLQKQINDLRERISKATSPFQQQLSVQAAALSGDAARLLLNDVLDWRVIFLDRPFDRPPG